MKKPNYYKVKNKKKNPSHSRELEILRLVSQSHESGLLSAMQVLKILTYCTAVTESKTQSPQQRTDDMLRLHRELVRQVVSNPNVLH